MVGVSGREMLAAILAGEEDPAVLAELARGRLRAKLPALRQALVGRVQPQHRLLIERILAHIDFLEEAVSQGQDEIEQHLTAEATALELLQTIPGVGATTAATIIAEIGTAMSRFPSAKHLASWAGLCPGNKQSAGKRLGGRITAGNTWLRAALGEVAWAISHTKGNYLAAQYHRLARRRGKYKAAVAVAHSALVLISHVLRDRQPYTDLGADYFDKLDATGVERYHVARLKQLGYEVTLTPAKVA